MTTEITESKNREDRVLTWIREGLVRYRAELAGHKVVLFGSRARRNHRVRSDFDIGVVGDRPLDLRDFNRIGDYFEALPTLHRIDWVDLNRATEKFRSSAMDQAEVLYG